MRPRDVVYERQPHVGNRGADLAGEHLAYG
jgi:hypothetical protein